jgi:hypothetical protein
MRALSRIKIYTLILFCAAPVNAQTYEPVLIPPQISGNPTTMTPLNLGDDATRRVNLGFEFDYWGQTFTDVWVSSNGFVSFQSGAHLCCSGQPIEQAQRNTIYAYWSDLISFTGNPYYRLSEGSALFGWYGVQEFGTNNSSTFEIGLFSDGKIQLNYGNLGFSGRRNFTSGITGPNADDNIQLFFGQNAQFLQNQSGILTRPVPEVAAVDCRTTPMDPSCPPISIDATPDPVTNVSEAIADAIEQSTELEPEEMEQVLEVATAALEQEEAVEIAETTESTEELEANTETTARELDLTERLEPDQVAALAANGNSAEDSAQSQDTFVQETQGGSSSSGTFTAQVRFDSSFGGSFIPGSTMSVSQSASPLDMAISAGNPLSMSNTVEALGLGSPPPATSGGNTQQSESGMAEGQSETISEMGAVPGFAAYTQASLQDRADFYAVRDIYRRRRLQDANFEMYRLMQTNDAKWREMVDEQYR